MKSSNSVNKKAVILLVSTAVLLVFGFIFFFTDLISADSSTLPSIQTTVAPKADVNSSYKLQAMATVDAISITSYAKLGYRWNPNQVQTVSGKEVRGVWVNNDGKVWTNEGRSQADIELHNALNEAMYLANQTIKTPSKSNALALDKQIQTTNAIMVQPAATAATASNKLVVAVQTINNISDGYLGYRWDPNKTQTVNGKEVRGAWVNDAGETWDKTKHTSAENLLHNQCNEALAAYNQAQTNPAVVAHADALNKQLQLTLQKPDVQVIKVKSDKETIQKISEDYLGYKWDGNAWSKDGVSWANSTHTEAETRLHNALNQAMYEANLIDKDPKLAAPFAKHMGEVTDLLADPEVAALNKAATGLDAGAPVASASAAENKSNIFTRIYDGVANPLVTAWNFITNAIGANEKDLSSDERAQINESARAQAEAMKLLIATASATGAEKYFSMETIVFLNDNSNAIVEDIAKNNGFCIGSCALLLATAMQPNNIDDQRIVASYISTMPIDMEAMKSSVAGIVDSARKNGVNANENTVKTLEFAEYVSNMIESNDILKTSYRTGISMNTATGHMEYVTSIKKKVACAGGAQSDNCFESIGYIAFDPFTQKYTANVPVEFSGQKITLVSDRNGNVYADLNKLNGNAYIALGQDGKYFQLTSIQVARDGSVGGSFKAFGQLFSYNANTKSFQIPLPVDRLLPRSAKNLLGDQVVSGMGSLMIDTRGVISGAIDLAKFNTKTINVVDSQGKQVYDKVVVTGPDGKPVIDPVTGEQQTKDVARTKEISTGSNIGMSFDSKGNLAVNYTYNNASGNSIGGISVGLNGNISGSINVGQLVGLGNIGIGFDKNGITGASLPIGSVAGVGVSLSISKDGGLGIGGFVPVGPIPIPLSIGQSAKGGFKLAGPGFSIGLGGDDKRPLTPPTPKMISGTKNYDMSEVYYAHSLKKLLKTIRVYQVPAMKLTPDQQKARSAKIFAIYKEMLQRNPSTNEFMNWYFWSGHQPYALIGSKTPEEMLSLMAEVMKTTIQGKWYGSVQKEYRFINGEEYNCVKRYTNLSDAFANVCSRPKDIMTSDPFTAGTETAKSTQVDPTLKSFLDAVSKSADTSSSQATTTSTSQTAGTNTQE